ncbi:MAG: SBBP repeat-containing protein [Bacteroidota bacterium]|nr:SBBP repeat-containing protein [Bacteroidota bacterium]
MNNISKIYLLLFLTLYNSDFISSQIKEEWAVRFSQISNSNDGATDISLDKSGNIYVTGASLSQGNQSDYATIKYNFDGIQQWVKTYNGPGNREDIANAIAIDNYGNVYITGSSEAYSSGVDFATIKYSSSGVELWVKRFTSEGIHLDAGYKIAVDNSDNVYIVGESYNDSLLVRDNCTIKYDSSGTLQWVRKYHGGILYDLTIDDSNNVYVSGVNLDDVVTIKYNSSGTQKWVSRYDGQLNEDDFALSIGVDSLFNVYVSGSSEEIPMTFGGYLTIKYNNLGIREWVRIYEGTGNFLDVARAMQVDRSGNVYVTGYSTESGQGYNMTTIKYNTYGDTLWKASYHNGLNDIAFAITFDKSGNVYVTGESDGNGTSDDYATVKYNSFGQQQWVKRYDYSGQFADIASKIAVDNAGNLYVTGSSNRDFLTIKYSQPTEIINLLLEIPSEFNLEQNYPNPFNPSTNISYQLPASSFISLKVFDILGKEVATLVNQKQNAGSYSVSFDGSNLSNGIYFYKIEADNFIETKRMILIK